MVLERIANPSDVNSVFRVRVSATPPIIMARLLVFTAQGLRNHDGNVRFIYGSLKILGDGNGIRFPTGPLMGSKVAGSYTGLENLLALKNTLGIETSATRQQQLRYYHDRNNWWYINSIIDIIKHSF
jgi:hypothetical protein